MEANGIIARIVGLEGSNRALWDEHREMRGDIGGLKTGQALTSDRVAENKADIATLNTRLDRLTRAFWAAAGTFATLTVAVIGLVATILSG